MMKQMITKMRAYTVEHDPTVKKRIDCKDCFNFEIDSGTYNYEKTVATQEIWNVISMERNK